MKKPSRTASPISLLPTELLDRASALLVAREVRRPPETLAFLAQRILRWWTAIKGAPEFEAGALKPLAREFREMGFECQPGKAPRWTPKQREQADALFLDLVLLAVGTPAPVLPELRQDLEARDREALVRLLWNHLDHHVTALTLGLLGSGLLAVRPEDPRFEAEAPVRERIVQIVGTLVAFALYLGGDRGSDMPMDQAATTISALLDGLAASLEEAFAAGGPRGAWLAQAGGWSRPEYPCRMGEFGSFVQSLPPQVQPE